MKSFREIKGVMLLYMIGPRGIEVEFLSVDEDKRGQGLGTRAMRRLLKLARKCKLPVRLTAAPEPRKKSALNRFYRRLGFKRNWKYPGKYTEFVWTPKQS